MIGALSLIALVGCGSGAADSEFDSTALDVVDAAVADAAEETDARAEDGIGVEPDVTPDAGDDDVSVDSEFDLGSDVADVQPGDPCLTSDEEPNESAETAFNVLSGRTVAARLCEVDEDWFAFDLAAASSAEIEIRFRHRRGDLELEWYLDPEAAPIAEAVSGNDDELLVVTPSREARRIFVRVYGFEGALNDYELEVNVQDNPGAVWTTVSGQVEYEDQEFGIEGFTGGLARLPARHIRVEAVDLATGATLGTSQTDSSGAFSVDALLGDDVDLSVRAVSALSLDGFSAEVRDRSGNDLYFVSSGRIDASPATDVLVLATQSKVGGAFNILDVTVDAFTFVGLYTDERSPTLAYSWERPRSFSCGSCYSSNTVSIGGQLEDPDEYDDDIILHEFGHYFVDHFSADSSPGGAHRDRQVSPGLAYGEGLAYFWAAMVFNEAIITDNFLGSYRSIDFEFATQNGEAREDMFGTSDGTITGNRREEVSGAILWDLYDPASEAEPFDQVALGADAIMEVLLLDFDGEQRLPDVGARNIDLADALNAVYCRFPEVRADIQPIVDARGYPYDVAASAVCSNP